MQSVAVEVAGQQLITPARHPLAVPTQALADAIAGEWQSAKKYNPAVMPLTSLAYTAVDRLAGNESAVIEALLVYVDTDALCYRASQASVAKEQQERWDPLLRELGKKLGVEILTVTGLMPLDQSPVLHQGVSDALMEMTPYELAAACMLASGYSSLLLTLAVYWKLCTAEEAFSLSRLEEDAQAAQWGVDPEAAERSLRLKQELLATTRCFELVKAA